MIYLELSEIVGLAGLDDMPTLGNLSCPLAGIKPIMNSECPQWQGFRARRTACSIPTAVGGVGGPKYAVGVHTLSTSMRRLMER